MPNPSPAIGPDAVLPPPPLGRRHAVGGRRLMLHRSGSGGPAVVFLPGGGMVGLDYLNIHDRTAELTTSVLYDRAGTGWSDRAELPRSAGEVADELHGLLRSADIPAPYILVGHSLGGSYARMFAQRFPAQVAGLLLLDPSHEDFLARVPEEVRQHTEQMRQQLEQLRIEGLPDPTPEQLRQVLDQLAPISGGWPESVRRPLVDYHLDAWRTSLDEAWNLDSEIADELRSGPGLPDVPLIVLTALAEEEAEARMWPAETRQKCSDAKAALHAELARSVRNGEHRTLADAGHVWLHEQRADAVLRAIDDLLRTAR
ncbi:alpha/beta fold hydrolase [Embleya scabrispora]|uniref:alpha/beta fold hydrolase n=1 Tax=Embleya scabrispora TaxID=159449 RepID=UPI0007C56030|nr:alpha/beta hydrolase [Embleya scabrispora]MYS86732.1 alpha/beta fold hydrolase [Streptomyces sp. SID5474]